MRDDPKTPVQVRDVATGRFYDLEAVAPIAKGGEAWIHKVRGDPSLVAKVYKKRDTDSDSEFEKRRSEVVEKLAVMLANRPRNPTAQHNHESYAWPTAMISRRNDNSVIGFLMPRIGEMKELFQVYNPSSRRLECPYFDYRYLIQTARNICGIMREIHSKNYVVGDVNQKNILVSDRAMVTVIDTDSFQIKDPRTGHLYLCCVRTDGFIAPEATSPGRRDVERTVEQDLFGLAVLVFLLLMEGVHPFSGIDPGVAEPGTIQQRVISGAFAYAPGSKLLPMRTAPGFETLHPELRELFIRCFVDGHSKPDARPSASDWKRALSTAAKELRNCNVNEHHIHGAHLGDTCPWCARVSRGLNDSFPKKSSVKTVSPSLRPPDNKNRPAATSPTPITLTSEPVTTGLLSGKGWAILIGAMVFIVLLIIVLSR
jgi:DNA-binding helix-hairpin-helix protein with protein kinase domain